jgi:hypothetical protein
MQKLNFMVGRWVGPGWSLGDNGGRVDFIQSEQVNLLLSGELMTVQGTGRVGGVPSFSAFATATFDPTTATYPWQAFSQGSVAEATLGVTDNRFTWSFDPAPGITVRYDAAFRRHVARDRRGVRRRRGDMEAEPRHDTEPGGRSFLRRTPDVIEPVDSDRIIAGQLGHGQPDQERYEDSPRQTKRLPRNQREDNQTEEDEDGDSAVRRPRSMLSGASSTASVTGSNVPSL